MSTQTRTYFGFLFNSQEAGANLDRLLRERGMSKNELARRAGIQDEAIWRFIKTGRGISAERWIKIAEVLEMPVEHIFGYQRITEKNLPVS